MYKKTVKSKDQEVHGSEGYIMPVHYIDHLVGKVLTLIEAIGLKDGQEKSIKDLVKQEIWGITRDMSLTHGKLLSLVNELTTDVEDEQQRRALNDDSTTNIPMSMLQGDYEITFVEKEDK